MSDNSIIFKGVQNGILILLDDKVKFTELKDTLIKKVNDAKKFFQGANISITFKGRILSEEEETELLEIISKESGLEISFVNKILTLDNTDKEANNENKTNPPILTSKKNITYFHKGSLRSGQRLDFPGSITVIGDINPGAKILAEGNIIILGKLKGVAHAGCKGAKDCFISALYMSPSQLIIGDCLAYFPPEINRKICPEYAYVKDEQIYVEPLINL